MFSEFGNVNESRVLQSQKTELKPPKAKFIKESFGDKQVVEPGKEFTKTWTFQNNGEDSWPEDTKFIFINGAEFGETIKDIYEEVRPGQIIDMIVKFKAPISIGTYCGFYRFAFQQKKKQFGQKVWCDILVQEQEDELAKLQREMNQFMSGPAQPLPVQQPAYDPQRANLDNSF